MSKHVFVQNCPALSYMALGDAAVRIAALDHIIRRHRLDAFVVVARNGLEPLWQAVFGDRVGQQIPPAFADARVSRPTALDWGMGAAAWNVFESVFWENGFFDTAGLYLAPPCVFRCEPTARAVMFCLMDVSGSMDEERKDIAKRFFILLYLFLTRNYEHIDVIFIRHHTTAKEVDEDEFFHSRETGGTVVSSALEMMHNIILERYPSSLWNIYAAQASDGDNWNDDSPLCRNLLIEKIMPLLQYFAYVEIKPDEHQSLWREYLHVKTRCKNFALQRIDGLTDIYPVFRKLFRKKAAA